MSEAVVPDLTTIKQAKTKKHSKDESSKNKSKKNKRDADHDDAQKRKHKKRKHAHHPVEKAEKAEKAAKESSQSITIDNATDKVINDSDSGSDSEQEQLQNTKKKTNFTVTSDRILPLLHRVYDDDVDLKTKMKRRNMAMGTLKINRDYYISDSDEDSDSDNEYQSTKYEWHQKMYTAKTLKANVESGKWQIKTGRLTLQELLMLEKRIKKIGRRHNLSLPELRDTILDDKPNNQALFWQQIVHVFPNRSLLQIYTHTKKCYHEDAYKGRWSKEEDENLLELVKLSDRKFTEIATKLGRTQRACIDRHRELTNKTNKPRTHWTKDEFAKLEKAVKEYKQKNGNEISWEYIATEYFSGERSALQLRKKWDTDQTVHDSAKVIVRHMKDATLQVQLMLFERMQKKNWASEDMINYGQLNDKEFNISKETARRTYYKMRDALHGFERMKYPEIIDRLVTSRRAMVESLGE